MKKDLTVMTDEEVLDQYDYARGDMSYYNAAEGNWSKETNARNAAKSYLNEVWAEVTKRNLMPHPGNYLL